VANSVTTTYPLNGSRNFTAKIDIVGDGTGEATAVDVIDVANLTGTPTKFKIKRITWQFNEFNAKLYWDASTDVLATALNQYEGDIDFFDSAGVPLINNAGSGVTGKLQLTTVGLGSGDAGTIYIHGYH
jgi:hypothetical protein